MMLRVLRSLVALAVLGSFASSVRAATTNTWIFPYDSRDSSSGITLAQESYTNIEFNTTYPDYSLVLEPKGYPNRTSSTGIKWYPILYGNASLPMPYLFYLGPNVDLSGGNTFKLSVVNGTTGPSSSQASFDTVDITIVPANTSATTLAGSGGSATTTPSSTGSSSAGTGSGSNSIAIGAGVGVGVGIPLILVIVGLAICIPRRRRKQRATDGAEAASRGSPTQQVARKKAKTKSGVRGGELGSNTVEELPAYTELASAPVRRELPG